MATGELVKPGENCTLACVHGVPCVDDHAGYVDMHRWLGCDVCSPPIAIHVHGRDWIVRQTAGVGSHVGLLWQDVDGDPGNSGARIDDDRVEAAMQAVEAALWAAAWRKTPHYQELLKQHGKEGQ